MSATRPVPIDVPLKRLDGKPVRLSYYRGRPLVLVFGSYTHPGFREKAAALDALSRRHGRRVGFLLVYTREAHPAGGWEVQRNLDQGISVRQHKSEDERLSAAKDARAKLKLTMPVVIDPMDDPASAAFDGFPNAAVVLTPEGEIVARQRHAEPHGLEIWIEEVLRPPPSTRPKAD